MYEVRKACWILNVFDLISDANILESEICNDCVALGALQFGVFTFCFKADLYLMHFLTKKNY